MKCISKKQSLAVTYSQRRIINLDPFYQVDSCRWVLSQKQLFIDSLINTMIRLKFIYMIVHLHRSIQRDIRIL